jgi:hypothetical protein
MHGSRMDVFLQIDTHIRGWVELSPEDPMNDNRPEQSDTQSHGMTRLVAGFNAGWRAVTAAWARITPSSPPYDATARKADAEVPPAKKSGH